MENTVIHCETKEQAKKLFEILQSQGYKWCDGISLTEEAYWDSYEADTCYRIDNKNIYFADKSFYERDGYQIISATEFLKNNKK